MKKEVLDVVPATEAALAPAGPPPTLMHILQEAVQRGAPVDVMERLIALKERVDKAEAEKEFNAAKSRLHQKLPQIEQNGTIVVPARDGKAGHKSKYTKYEDIDLIVRPILAEDGFSIEFDAPDATGDSISMTCTLKHRLGHEVTKRLKLPIDRSGSKNATQAVGSTVSYGKRYLLEMQLNLVKKGEDIDGNHPATVEPLTQEQADEITGLLTTVTELGFASARKNFLTWLNVDSVASIPQSEYDRAVTELKKKIKTAEKPR